MSDRFGPILIACPLLLALTSGCVERVVDARGGLYGIPGAEGGYDVPGNRRGAMSVEEILLTFQPEDPDLEPIEDAPLRFTDSEGELYVASRSPRHVIYHLNEMLMRDEEDLLYEWIISDATKQRYRERFRSPRDAVTFLTDHKEAIIDFLLLMPQGELTPGVTMSTPAPNVIRLSPDLPRKYTGVRYRVLDVTIEHGRCVVLNIE